MNQTQSQTTRLVAYGGVLAALILVVTRFSAMPILNGQGYINLGDATILFAAAVLGPTAIIPAALGSAMADLWAGYIQYAPATLIIKGLVAWIAVLFLRKATAPLWLKIFGFAIAELVMAGGYFVFEIFMLGFATALFDLTFNLIQGGVCLVIGLALLPVAERIVKANNIQR
ncbi:MAG: ECF transporter S component [Eubacteriales bacterium]|nr:ECF transporter S component [Eubacteriales bacterium]